MKNDCIIYDFETLGQQPKESVVLSMAALPFTEARFLSDNPYTYEELLCSTKFIKFDVKEQVSIYKRKIDNGTLEWWSKQPAEARKSLTPSSEDVPLVEIYPFIMDLVNEPKNVKKVYTRGNTFDPLFLESLLEAMSKKDPFPWWNIRDTRSMIEGMSYGADMSNSFMPEGLEKAFIKHNPIHDVSIDVMRIQTLARILIM
jgi:hypothetical protein